MKKMILIVMAVMVMFGATACGKKIDYDKERLASMKKGVKELYNENKEEYKDYDFFYKEDCGIEELDKFTKLYWAEITLENGDQTRKVVYRRSLEMYECGNYATVKNDESIGCLRPIMIR